MRSRLAGGVLASLLGLAGTAAILPGTAGANQATTSTRVAGTDRYGTAAQAAQLAFPAKVTKIILASGEAVSATDNNSPDALAASGLAGAAGAPILLTAKNSLPAVTANALGTLTTSPATTTIYIAGGTAAVSQSVRDQLKALGYTLVELSGTDRYDTASKVATQMATLTAIGQFNGQPAAIVATGEAFADALAGGVAAFGKKFPVLLTPSAVLGASAAASLTTLGVKQAIVLGGTSAISQVNEDAIKAKGITVTRLAGTNRFDTAAKIATFEITPAASSGLGLFTAPFGVTLANGLNFPDALSAAPLAALGSASAVPAIAKGPLLLTASIPPDTAAFLSTNKASISSIAALGGTAVISDADIASAKTSSTTATPTATIVANDGNRSFTVTFSEAVTAASAGTVGFYKLNNVAIAGSGTGVVVNATNTTAVVTLPTGTVLHPGDVVSATNAIVTADGRAIANTSVTVAADITKPTATVQPYVGTNRTWIFFSEPISTASLQPSDLTRTGTGTFGTTPTFTYPTSALSNGSNAATAVMVTNDAGNGANWIAGDTATLIAGAVDDLAFTPNTSTAATGTAISDVVAPSASTAKFVTTATVQATQLTAGAGKVAVTANKGGTADGVLGNGWQIAVAEGNAAPSVAVNTSTKLITVTADTDNSAGLRPTASTLSNVLNANTTFASAFTATVNTVGNVDALTAATNLAGGQNITTVTLTFNEPYDPATALAGTFGLDYDGSAATPDVAVTSTDTSGFKSNIVVLSITQSGAGSQNQLPISGTSKITISTALKDLAGNANVLASSVTVTS